MKDPARIARDAVAETFRPVVAAIYSASLDTAYAAELDEDQYERYGVTLDERISAAFLIGISRGGADLTEKFQPLVDGFGHDLVAVCDCDRGTDGRVGRPSRSRRPTCCSNRGKQFDETLRAEIQIQLGSVLAAWDVDRLLRDAADGPTE